MEHKIIEIISKVTKIPVSDLEAQKDERNLWDSLKHMEIVISLEEEFDITFENEDIANAKTVSAVIQIVKNKAE